MPFDDTLPFEATIAEPNARTPLCWIKETYQEHNLKQTIANVFVSPEEKRKEDAGKGDYATWGFKRWDMTVSFVVVRVRRGGMVEDRNGKRMWSGREVVQRWW